MTSIFFINLLIFGWALLVLVGVLSSLAARRFGVPLLLIFLSIGMLAGEDGPGGIVFDDFRLTYLIGSSALAIILFNGGLRTKLSAFRGVLVPSMLLATVGVGITAGITGLAASWLLGVSWLQGLLIGTVVASTDAAAVFFLIRAGGIQLRHRVGSILEIESATNDPTSIFLTFVLVGLMGAEAKGSGLEIIVEFGQQALFGTAVGLVGGLAVSNLINRVDLASGLHALFVIAAAIAIFAFTGLIGGSGYLAVYLAGLVIGNRPLRAYASIVTFQDTATWLAQIVMFMVLGLFASPSRLLGVALPTLGVAAFLMLVARPVAVWLCLAPFRFDRREIAFVSWVGLRGAVGIFLATVPMLSGLPSAHTYFDTAFFVVLVSLIIQGWTLTGAARCLHLALPRTARPVHRVELDLPGQLTRELVGYPVLAGSRALVKKSLPGWVRLVLIVRDNSIIEPSEADRLAEGDYAYLLVPPERASRLDRLFAVDEEAAAGEVRGEFPLAGDAPLGQLAEFYGVPVDLADMRRTITQLFNDRFEAQPHIGDRLPFGRAELVVRAVDDDRVTRASLLLDNLADSVIATAMLGPGRWARALRALRRLGLLKAG
jgi:cell volume regulation protein A